MEDKQEEILVKRMFMAIGTFFLVLFGLYLTDGDDKKKK